MSERDQLLQGLSQLNISTTEAQREQVDQYVALLMKWQQRFNLIGPDTVPYIYTRHILDSAQVVPFIHDGDSVLDIGAGAGLPSIVVAILTRAEVFACERNWKKAQFMNEVRRQLGLTNFNVLNEDVKNLSKKEKRFNVITARAFSKVSAILELAKDVKTEDGKYVLLKGGNFEDEISDALNKINSTCDIRESITSNTGKILVLT